MCVAVPAPIIDITPDVVPIAHVQRGEDVLQCNLMYFPEAVPGDYVMIQHGVAMQLVDPESAADSLAAAEIGVPVDSAH